MKKLFPHALDLVPIPAGGHAGDDALEEPDLRQLLLDHRSRGAKEEEWLAAIIARRSIRPNHLWQDLGLFNRAELNRLLHRHFHALAVQNSKDMKWKKFFYRTLCQRDGILICKAPNLRDLRGRADLLWRGGRRAARRLPGDLVAKATKLTPCPEPAIAFCGKPFYLTELRLARSLLSQG